MNIRAREDSETVDRYSPEQVNRSDEKLRKVYVCVTCSNEQQSLVKGRGRCGARRLEHIESLRQRYGEEWRLMIEPDDGWVH